MKKVALIVSQLRVTQWIKNLIIFSGYLFGRGWLVPGLTEKSVAVFVQFCFAASLVYIANDIRDIDSDRQHPDKKKRPLASGRLSLSTAYILMAALASALILLGIFTEIEWGFVIAYIVLNVFYLLWLKKIVLVDVFCISAGFMLRILAGSEGIGIEPSKWILLEGMVVSLFFGFSKRLSELMGQKAAKADHGRSVLGVYNIEGLRGFVNICATCVILAYGLYAVDPETIQLHKTEKIIWTLPFVVFGIFRYLHLLNEAKGVGENTSRDLLSDPMLLGSAVVWAASVVWLIS